MTTDIGNASTCREQILNLVGQNDPVRCLKIPPGPGNDGEGDLATRRLQGLHVVPQSFFRRVWRVAEPMQKDSSRARRITEVSRGAAGQFSVDNAIPQRKVGSCCGTQERATGLWFGEVAGLTLSAESRQKRLVSFLICAMAKRGIPSSWFRSQGTDPCPDTGLVPSSEGYTTYPEHPTTTGSA